MREIAPTVRTKNSLIRRWQCSSRRGSVFATDATAPRSRRFLFFFFICSLFFSQCAKYGGEKYRRCNKQDYDPFRRAVAHSASLRNIQRVTFATGLYPGINNARVLAATPRGTGAISLRSVLAFLPSDAYKYCKTRVWSKACGTLCKIQDHVCE